MNVVNERIKTVLQPALGGGVDNAAGRRGRDNRRSEPRRGPVGAAPAGARG